MITENEQDQASLYAMGALPEDQDLAFESQLRQRPELREWVKGLQRAVVALALSAPPAPLPPGLKAKVMARIGDLASPRTSGTAAPSGESRFFPGLRFLLDAASRDWKELPIKGAYVKLLSLERERGYAILMGKLDPGTSYPAHTNAGPEDFYILSGDLYIGATRLNAGDFHHADGGSEHTINHSQSGCTLLAVLTTDDPLVAYAMG